MNSFDPEKHEYRIDNISVPSVSAVLAPLSDFSSVHPAIMKAACEYGNNCHKTIELWIKDDLYEGNLDPHLKNVLRQFEAWTNGPIYKHPMKDWIVEKPMFDPKLKYGGTPDIVIPGHAIIDFKTSKYNPITHDIQLAAYQLLAKENGGTGKEKLYVLELSESHYKQIEVKNSQAKNMFLYLLESYHRQAETKNKISQWKNFCLTK